MAPPLAILLPLLTFSGAVAAQESPAPHAPEENGAVIRQVILDKSDVFDLSNPDEDKALYRLANRLHIVTKDKFIEQQLLFQSGTAYSQRLLDESARLLRQNRYFYNAEIKPIHVEDGIVDIVVTTHDVWSLGPDISASRSGGENRTQIGIEETNLLGRGQTLRYNHKEDVDRTSDSFEFFDRNFSETWVSTFLRLADNSDGKSNLLSVVRPFYALDARWTAGVQALDDDRRGALYLAGEETAEYQHESRNFSAFGGGSKGLNDGFARRWTLGVTHDENRYSEVSNPALPPLLPEDRKLVYAFVGYEVVQDEFEASSDRDQIGRTEDFFMGAYLSTMLGWSDQSLGADRDALIYRASASRGFGSLKKSAVIASAAARGRLESGRSANSTLSFAVRYYRTQSPKRLFFAKLSATAGHALDLDNPIHIGGKTGLRGYPLRYQNGDSKLLVTIEQRYFTDWYPFRLARIGGAIFADAGRVWGRNPLGEEQRGWLTDIGIGFRIAPTRGSSGKVVHLDLAFPLNGDETIDDVQILLEAKRSF
jgi:outer membrane protein assembly factor BamA